MSSAEKVKQIIQKKFYVENILDSTLIQEELGANSLDKVELIIAFENEFGIIIHDDAATKIRTIHDAISAIDERVLTKVYNNELFL